MADPSPGKWFSLGRKSFHGDNSSKIQLVSRKDHHWGRGDRESKSQRGSRSVCGRGWGWGCREMGNVFALPLPAAIYYEEALRSYLHHYPTRALLTHHRKQPTACSGTHYRRGTSSSILPLPASPRYWQGQHRAYGDAPSNLLQLGLSTRPQHTLGHFCRR